MSNNVKPDWLETLTKEISDGLPEDRREWWHAALAESLPVADVCWQPYFHHICIRILELVLCQKPSWKDPYAATADNAFRLAIEYHRDPVDERRLAAWSAINSVALPVSDPAAHSAVWTASFSMDPNGQVSWAAVYAAESVAWPGNALNLEAYALAESAAWLRIAEEVIDVFLSGRGNNN